MALIQSNLTITSIAVMYNIARSKYPIILILNQLQYYYLLKSFIFKYMYQNSPSINFKLEDDEATHKKSEDVSYNLSNTHAQVTTHQKQIFLLEQDSNFKCKKLNVSSTNGKQKLYQKSSNQNLKTEQFFQEFDKHFKIQFKSPPKIVNDDNYITKPLIEIFQEQQELIQSKIMVKEQNPKNNIEIIQQQLMTKTIKFKRYNKLDKITTIKRKILQQSQKKNILQTPPLIQANQKEIFEKILSHRNDENKISPKITSFNKKNRTLVSMDYAKKKQIQEKNIFKIPLQEIDPLNNRMNILLGKIQTKNKNESDSEEISKIKRKFRLVKYRSSNSGPKKVDIKLA